MISHDLQVGQKTSTLRTPSERFRKHIPLVFGQLNWKGHAASFLQITSSTTTTSTSSTTTTTFLGRASAELSASNLLRQHQVVGPVKTHWESRILKDVLLEHRRFEISTGFSSPEDWSGHRCCTKVSGSGELFTKSLRRSGSLEFSTALPQKTSESPQGNDTPWQSGSTQNPTFLSSPISVFAWFSKDWGAWSFSRSDPWDRADPVARRWTMPPSTTVLWCPPWGRLVMHGYAWHKLSCSDGNTPQDFALQDYTHIMMYIQSSFSILDAEENILIRVDFRNSRPSKLPDAQSFALTLRWTKYTAGHPNQRRAGQTTIRELTANDPKGPNWRKCKEPKWLILYNYIIINQKWLILFSQGERGTAYNGGVLHGHC